VRVAGWALTKGRPGGPAASLGAAVREAAAAVGAAPADLAAVEIHEESAALCLGAAAELGLDPDSINRRGGAIATGSAGAAAGPALVSRARDQLLAADGSGAAVAAMPAPGDQALALALELAGPESL
jgi:acetyl-CoA acetyltransferase